MEKQVKRGTGTPQKKATPQKKVTPQKKATFKRNIPDVSAMPKTYQVVNGANYILKISSKNVRVFDKETNQVRAIRYCPLENSVFMDEQSQGSRVGHVMFEDKYLIVPVSKPNLQNFMDLHPGNVANGGNIFKLVNKEENFEQDIESEFKISDAISIIKARPMDELLPVALALNINTNQKDLAIKHALIKLAKSNPDKFLSTLDSPMVNARSVVSQSLDFQIIEDRNGAVVWFDTELERQLEAIA